MMSYEVMWPQDHLVYVGRNGVGKCRGLSIEQFDKRAGKFLIIQPINSKNVTAHCSIEFPISKIEDIIRVLKEIQCLAQKQ